MSGWRWLAVSTVLAAVLGAGAWKAWAAFRQVEGTVLAVRHEVRVAESDARTRDLAGLAHTLVPLASHLDELQADLTALQIASNWPVIGPYYRNAARLLTGAVDGVAGAEMGLRVVGVAAHGDPGMRLSSSLLTAVGDLAQTQAVWARINPAHLPTVLEASGRLAVKTAAALTPISLASRYSASLAQALGINGPATWLLVLQDSGELRASGGFMAGCGLVTVNHGQITGAAVQGIKECSAGGRLSWPPPWLLRHFFGSRTWALLNINLSPDVPTTAQRILTLYDSKPHAPMVVGVAFVDTWMVQQLVGLLGPIRIPGPTGQMVTLTAANVYPDMLTFAEQTYYPGQPRKQFLNAIMEGLVARMTHAPLAQRLSILHAIAQDLSRKDLMFYLRNPGAETVVKQLNWGGAVDRHVPSDYLMVVDQNFGAHKDNEYLTESVATSLHRSETRTEQTTRVTLTMPVPADGWLTVPYQGWVSVYIPLGSQLIGVQGDNPAIVRTQVDKTLNKTVIGCAVRVPAPAGPGSPPVSDTISISYWLPSSVSTHALTIQKQPGVEAIPYAVNEGSWRQSWTLTQDAKVSLP